MFTAGEPNRLTPFKGAQGKRLFVFELPVPREVEEQAVVPELHWNPDRLLSFLSAVRERAPVTGGDLPERVDCHLRLEPELLPDSPVKGFLEYAVVELFLLPGPPADEV